MLININGQSYTRWEDVPEDVRAQLAATLPDTDHNGVPDLLEGNLSGVQAMVQGAMQSGGTPAQSFTSVSVDGQQVSSLGQLPPEVQELLKNTLGIFQPGSVVAPPPATGTSLQPGQVMLNGVPTTVGEAVEVRKPWWKRIFGS
ncbi:hypothetical protein [Nocardioides halotolerans]|jgi:hypothetical protein|uniref:hypothetical protein n=1 Tax=Nocardioides halotolerans TaxID=433660 RepID=UPI000407315C|nr:hypothetical protein [Nocardioides halotolerans]